MNRAMEIGWAFSLCLMCVVLASSVAVADGVPEPGITLYGRVLADDGSLVTQGRLVWTFVPATSPNSLRVTVSADLVPIADGAGNTFSYCIHIPAEMPVPGMALSGSRLPATASQAIYQRSAMVDGAFTAFVSESFRTTTFSYPERGKVERVDLITGIYGPPDIPWGPSPVHGELLVPLDNALDWADSARAVSYDIYLWPAGTVKPGLPTASGLTLSRFQPPLPLRPDTDYIWQVVAGNSKGSTPGPLWRFRTAFQGDLQKLLEYLLGKRYLSFQEQATLDLNSDGDLDIADFVSGLRRSRYYSTLADNQSSSTRPGALAGTTTPTLGRRTFAIGGGEVWSEESAPVSLPMGILPGADGVAGVNLHIETDPTIVEFVGVRACRTHSGEFLYSHSPTPGVVNVVFFANPVNPIQADSACILWLDLRVWLSLNLPYSVIHLEGAALSDVNGLAATEVRRMDGFVLYRNAMTSSSRWELYR